MKIKKTLKKLLLTVTVVSTIFSNAGYAFSDLASDHWAYNVVSEMVNRNVLSGYNDGTFKPNSNITRAEFSTILVKTLGINKKGTSIEYSDVQGHWAKDFIDSADEFLTGYKSNSKNYFKPEEAALREDAAVAIVKAKELTNEVVDVNILSKFSDRNDISEDKKKYVAIAVSNGLMNGNANGTFNPKGNLTRAEVAALFNNIYEYENDATIPIITVSSVDGSSVIPGDRIIVTIKSKSGLKNITYSWNNGKKIEPLKNDNKVYNEYEIVMSKFPKVNDTYVLKISATDINGNTTGLKEYSYKIVNVDNTAPVVTMSEPDESILEAGTGLILTVKDEESKVEYLRYKWIGSKEKILIPNEKEPANTCTIYIPKIGSEIGTYKFAVTARNAQGLETTKTYIYYVED